MAAQGTSCWVIFYVGTTGYNDVFFVVGAIVGLCNEILAFNEENQQKKEKVNDDMIKFELTSMKMRKRWFGRDQQ